MLPIVPSEFINLFCSIFMASTFVAVYLFQNPTVVGVYVAMFLK